MPAESHPAAVAFRGVEKSFGRQRVLRGLDFAPPPGAVVGLLGRNGSGKSTMLKLLVGLLKPDAGDATIDGHAGWDLADAVKADLGYVDQEPGFYPWLPPRFLFGYLGSFYERWDGRLLDRLAGEWDVPLDKPFGKLSPGNRQKVALMAALAPRPGLLLLDEPVSALDPTARRAFLKELIDWTTDGGDGPTVLLSSHLTGDLERVCSHAALLVGGRITLQGETGELKERVKRLRVQMDGRAPAGFAQGLPGLLLATTEADGGAAVVDGTAADAAATLRARLGSSVVVEEEALNLEEVFLEVTRGEAGRG